MRGEILGVERRRRWDVRTAVQKFATEVVG